MSILIGTAGHVDHGKTSLIKALTGIDADRLPEEKERGMTIDLGFAHLHFPGYGTVSIVDVPGHEKFVTNMLAGATSVRVALLCIASDEGVRAQTLEHLEILGVLPVERLVVALTRSDLVDANRIEEAKIEVRSILKGSRFVTAPLVPCSSVTGLGLDDLRAALLEAILSIKPSPAQPWYLPIDRVFTVKGHGTVVTGTLCGSTAQCGNCYSLPGGEEVRIRSIQVHGVSVETAEPGQRTAMNLGNVSSEDLTRGMVLAEPGGAFVTQRSQVSVRWKSAPKPRTRVRVAIGAADAIARVTCDPENPEIAFLNFEHPVAVAPTQPFVVRRYSPPELLGGGSIVIPVAALVRRETIQPVDGPLTLLQIVEATPKGIATEDICRKLGKTPQALGNEFEAHLAKGTLISLAGHWLTPASYEALVTTFCRFLSDLHDSEPETTYQPRETVLRKAQIRMEGKVLDRFISKMHADGRVVAQGTRVKVAGFKVQLSPKQRALLTRVAEQIVSEPISIPSHGEIANRLGIPIQAVKEIVKLGSEAGLLHQISDELAYSSKQLEKIRGDAIEVLGDRTFTAAQFKDALETSRKYAIPLLEYFDHLRWTVRKEDLRKLAPVPADKA